MENLNVSHLPPPARLTMTDQSCIQGSICERFNYLNKFVNIKFRLKYTNSRNITMFNTYYNCHVTDMINNPYNIFFNVLLTDAIDHTSMHREM